MTTTTDYYKIVYHVFTDGKDDWFDNYAEAEGLFEYWVEKYGNVRVYEEAFATKEAYETGQGEIIEECVLAAGDFPL